MGWWMMARSVSEQAAYEAMLARYLRSYRVVRVPKGEHGVGWWPRYRWRADIDRIVLDGRVRHGVGWMVDR